jgi:N-acetylglucosamine-6-phosphate deacetylase
MIGLTWRGDRIVEVVKVPDARPPRPDDDWVAPAFFDIQFNGRWGHSFSDPGITVDQAVRCILAQTALGSAHVCPTLITASFEATRHGVATITAACDAHPAVGRRVVGVHLEGPWISERDGYRGAHPLAAVRDPDWADFQAWQDASGGRIKLVTLAPERPGAIDMISRLVGLGVIVAIGHTAADEATLAAAVEAGARLSTHLGNGIEATLPRHPNPIWHQAADDRLMASLIADGHHLDRDTLKVLARAKGPERLVLVSDASPLAGLPPGHYPPWEVDPSGKIVVAGTPYLAGSNEPLAVGLGNLMKRGGHSLVEALATVTTNPARLLGLPSPRLEAGQAANLVVFRMEEGAMHVRSVWVDGEQVDLKLADQ